MTIGEKIKKLRKEKGLSQDFVANGIHVSRQAVSKWELNEALPDLDNVKLVSEMFGVSIDYLVKEELMCDENIHTVLSITEEFKTTYQTRYKKWALAIVSVSFFIVLFNQVLHLLSVPMNHFIWRLSFGIGAPLWKFWFIIALMFFIYFILNLKTKVQHK